MGELKTGAQIRIWSGENNNNETDNIAVMVYRKRLPAGVSFEKVRTAILSEVAEMVKTKFPYSYWVSPKAKDWLGKFKAGERQ